MKNIELNQKVLNKVIAFKMLEILKKYNMIDQSKYKKVEIKRMQYSTNVLKQGKLYKGGN